VPDPVVRQVRIDATPAVVWDALTDPRELAAWLGANADIDLRLGGAVRFRWPDGTERRGLVIELDPPRRLAFRWRELGAHGSGLTATEATVVTFSLQTETSGRRGGTLVTVTESNSILASDPPPLAMAENG
jgi:uncharacterized protein YndB with AHSA1/START domain